MSIAVYARKSVERENSISCETQTEYCMAMIKPDERDKRVLTFVDNGFSGGNINREGFQQMLTKIRQGEISKVIVYRLDRISRSLADFVEILEVFKKYGVEFVSTQEAFDTSSPYGELIVKILAVFAEFERRSIIQRVSQAYEHRSEMGFYMGGRRPYGFELEPTVINNVKTKKLKQIPDEAEQIKYIFQTYAMPNITLGKLLQVLSKDGVKSLENGAWTTAKLSTILKNPIYVKADNQIYEYFQRHGMQIISPPQSFDGVCGVQIYGKTKHKTQNSDWSDMKAVVMTHKGIVSAETWIRCQLKLAENRQIRNSVSNKTSWLGGKVICGNCQRTMTTIKSVVSGGEIRRYFVCTGKTHFRDCRGPDCTVYAECIENMVYKEIGERLKTLKPTICKRAKNTTPEINDLKNRLKCVELAENRIADAVIQQNADSGLLEILSNRATKLKEDKTGLLEKLKEIERTVAKKGTAKDFSKEWETASFEEKRGVCRVLINRLVVYENGNIEMIWNI